MFDFLNDFNIQEFIRSAALMAVPFLFAITVHEVMHGYVAYRLGDNTAKDMGRLTLNPIAHIDVVGLLVLLFTRMFGWAKPVPVNYYNIRHKYGMALVSVAGPLSNLALAIFSVILLNIFDYFMASYQVSNNIAYPIAKMIVYSIQINIALFVFNLLPILPLDGGRILNNFLPREAAIQYEKSEPFGFFIIMLLIFTGLIGRVISPIMKFIYGLLLSI